LVGVLWLSVLRIKSFALAGGKNSRDRVQVFNSSGVYQNTIGNNQFNGALGSRVADGETRSQIAATN
jgi:hypothetical protein